MMNRLTTLTAGLVLMAGVAFAAPGTVDTLRPGSGQSRAESRDRKDLQIFKDIASSIERYTQFTIFDDVNANVKDGVVTLTGRVTMPYKRDDIERRVAQLDGVREVRNRIETLPV